MTKFKGPVMQKDLTPSKLLMITDILLESDDLPISVSQIQYRLGSRRNVTMSKAEIEAHLDWGRMQPNATDAIVQPKYAGDVIRGRMGSEFKTPKFESIWTIVYKHPMTPEEHKAAGSPPWKYKV